MPKLTLAERCRVVRYAAGYGDRQATTFAHELGIKPSSLHNLESGKSRKLGKSLQGYIKKGANPEYLLHERGLPLTQPVGEKLRRVQELCGEIAVLQDHHLTIVEHVVRGYLPREAPAESEELADAQEVLQEASESRHPEVKADGDHGHVPGSPVGANRHPPGDASGKTNATGTGTRASTRAASRGTTPKSTKSTGKTPTKNVRRK